MPVTGFDPEDAAAFATTFIRMTAVARIALWSLLDMTLSDVAFQLAGNDVTLATLPTLGVPGVTILTNDNVELSTLHQQVKDLDNYYYHSIVASAGLLVGWVFFGDVSPFVQSQDLWGVGYATVSFTAQMAIGWML